MCQTVNTLGRKALSRMIGSETKLCPTRKTPFFRKLNAILAKTLYHGMRCGIKPHTYNETLTRRED